MKNKLSDLNNHLFEQLERLNDEELTDEQLEKEIQRTGAMSRIAGGIIKNAELALKTIQYMDEYGCENNKTVPEFLRDETNALPKKH